MVLTKYKLGELLEHSDIRNDKLEYTLDDIKGISIQKIFIETKANMKGVSLSPYKLVKPNDFAYVTVTSRNGEKISLAHNITEKVYIVSSSYEVFRVKNHDLLLPDYLFMYFNRLEFDRFSRFNSWGSARETFDWNEFCDIEIELPPISIQQKYVDVYNAMLENQKNYERGLKEIRLSFEYYIDIIKKENLIQIKNLIKLCNTKNQDKQLTLNVLRGINDQNEFVDTTANVDEQSITNYLIVKKNCFAVNFMCLGNWGKFYLALNDSNISYLISPACSVFSIKESSNLNPYYFMCLLQREEFQRKCVFCGDGNTRGGINNNDFKMISIPVPSENKQKIIANLFLTYKKRKEINEKLKSQLKDICPILIKGSIEEGRRMKEA
ncbi:restriction endonuclease subunit S [uncultured Parvimonas sp.]|uniref:restriction endonuclease subunit S n=1 Tax=uncultured Parvimonas sp. TaxID=747372 RepID=UPI0028D093C5|nr:restriction endonuclease subunit S [uncultured Parvimonas sp.]